MIAFRTDASSEIGIGHVMRCFALANAFAEYGVKSQFICRKLPDSMNLALKKAGHLVTIIGNPSARKSETPTGTVWLDVSEETDATETIRALKPNVAGVVVDHYALEFVWENSVTSSQNLPMLAIDDLCRKHSACLVLDTTFGRSADDYSFDASGGGEVLAGSKYALLRPEFSEMRPFALWRRQQKRSVNQILLTMGGADKDDLTAQFVDALLPKLIHRQIRLVVMTGSAYRNKDQISQRVVKSEGLLIHHHDTKNVAALMLESDLCIGAAGSSSWERCCLGLPTINVIIAENQINVCKQLAKVNAIVDGGSILPGTKDRFLTDLVSGDWMRKFLVPLIEDQEKRQNLSTNMSALVDGKGAALVASTFLKKVSNNNLINLRPAIPSDCKNIYRWRFDGDAVQFYKSTNVPKYSDHQKWYLAALTQPDRRMLIAQIGNKPVAHLRLDSIEFGVEVGICVDPNMRGNRIGEASILAIQDYSKVNGLGPLVAQIHQKNEISVRLFKSAGFKVSSTSNSFITLVFKT